MFCHFLSFSLFVFQHGFCGRLLNEFNQRVERITGLNATFVYFYLFCVLIARYSDFSELNLFIVLHSFKTYLTNELTLVHTHTRAYCCLLYFMLIYRK